MIGSSGSRIKILALYAGWMLGAQVVTALLQFGYAAVTSRLVADVGFGSYAVALSLGSLVMLISQGGLGQAAARTSELDPGKLSFLILCAVGLGVVAGLLLVVLATPWAALWDAPGAVAPARVTGVGALFAPLSGLLLGVLRRLGEFRMLAISTVVTSAAGMGTGVLAVVVVPGPVALIVAPVVSVLLLTITALVLTRSHWWAKPDATAARADLGFAWRALGLTMLSYLGGNVGKWSVSRWVGVDALGQWNRADVITAVPIEQVMNAFGNVVYPEFRHDVRVQSRTRQAWTDYLILVAWACFPFAAILAGVAPIAIAMLFGPGWELAAVIAPLVAIEYMVIAVDASLHKALESVGRFRLLVPTTVAFLVVTILGAIGTRLTGSWKVMLVALIAASILRHLLQVAFAVRFGALDGRSLMKGYCYALVVSVVLGGATALVSAGMIGGTGSAGAVAGAAILLAAAAVGIAARRYLPPVQIITRYRSSGALNQSSPDLLIEYPDR